MALQEKSEIVSVLAEQLTGSATDLDQAAALLDAQRKALQIRISQVDEWETEAMEARKSLMIVEQHAKQGLFVCVCQSKWRSGWHCEG